MLHRLSLAWHVLRGRPLIYRVTFCGRVTFDCDPPNGKVVECTFATRHRYVDGLNGDDANTGLSFATAWKTFAHVQDGDTVYATNASLATLTAHAMVYFGRPSTMTESIAPTLDDEIILTEYHTLPDGDIVTKRIPFER